MFNYLKKYYAIGLSSLLLFAKDLSAHTTNRVNISTSGTEADEISVWSAISRDGRYVVMESNASNLDPLDNETYSDIYLRDRVSSTLRLLSVNRFGIKGNNSSMKPSISADGSVIVFESYADNLVTSDSNKVPDIFVYDNNFSSIERISMAYDGSESNGASSDASISADGRFVVFTSKASNLVSDDTNGVADIFIYERASKITTRVSLGSSSEQANGASSEAHISSDGHFIVFASEASNLVAGDSNLVQDIFIKDRISGAINRLSVSNAGIEANDKSMQPKVNATGDIVVFSSMARNLITNDTNDRSDIFYVRDAHSNAPKIELASQNNTNEIGTGDSYAPSIDDTGRHVVFHSEAGNMIPLDINMSRDVFLRDMESGDITHISQASDGTRGESYSIYPAISGDGLHVSFVSAASTLVRNDTNKKMDIFVNDWNQVPVANYTVKDISIAGIKLTQKFDASASLDPDGSILSYSWDFGDKTTATGKIVTHKFPGKGTYVVTLKVVDNHGAEASFSETIRVHK